MPVTIKKTVGVTPLSGAQEITFEKNGNLVNVTVVYNNTTKTETSATWKLLWNSTFLKDNGSKVPDTKVRKTVKQTKQGKTPSTIIFDLVTNKDFGEVRIATGDLRKALLAIK